MDISQRASKMPSSPIRKLAPLAEAAKRNGTKVYHLNIGQPDIKTPQCGLDALKHVDREILEYSPSQGYLSLRTKFVSYYAQYGIDLSPDEIIVTTGGSIKEVIDVVKANGGIPVAVSMLVDRSGGKVNFGDVPCTALLHLNVETYKPEDCPLCKQGIPMTKRGRTGR